MLQVQPTTTYSETQCQCNHLTSFAAGFMVKPNTIDFDFVFSNLDFHKNPTLYITQILVAVIYLAFAIWARREDKKDLEKVGNYCRIKYHLLKIKGVLHCYQQLSNQLQNTASEIFTSASEGYVTIRVCPSVCLFVC